MVNLEQLRRDRQKAGHEGKVVGFFKKDGKTRPITKSVGELNRPRFMKPSRVGFKTVAPEGQKSKEETKPEDVKPEVGHDFNQRLEDTLEAPANLENEKETLENQKKFSEDPKNTPKIDCCLHGIYQKIREQKTVLKGLKV